MELQYFAALMTVPSLCWRRHRQPSRPPTELSLLLNVRMAASRGFAQAPALNSAYSAFPPTLDAHPTPAAARPRIAKRYNCTHMQDENLRDTRRAVKT
jgi:hypothetical protein